MKSSLIIGGQSDDFDRHESDFYPTPSECTRALVDFLNIGKETVIWEPACGNGAMSKVLEAYFTSVISTDIRPDCGFGIGGVDFLLSEKRSNCIITNPPFDISHAFIERCFDLEIEIYAMLLKSQYWHSKSRLSLFKKTKPSYILPLTWRPNFAPN